MNKRYLLIISSLLAIAIILSIIVYNNKLRRAYMYPGEFEKQQAIWLQWPEGQYVSASQSVLPAFINIIKAFVPHIRVNLISESKEEIAQIHDIFMENGCSEKNIVYYIVDHRSIWTRDVGPTFVKNGRNRLGVIDFGFNNYGKGASQDFINTESNIHRSVAQHLGLPLISTNLITEGGGIESNGRGTLMTTESVALNRNPGLTKTQIEDRYKKALGLKKVIWLKQGLAEDDLITRGHINEIARFASPNTILLAEVLPDDIHTNSTSYNSYLRLEENYKILRNATDQDGKPFRIIRIPMPPTLYSETDETGKIPVRSYLNYAITNGAVLIPSYWKPGRSDKVKTTEEEVKSLFKSIFPGREIIAIDVEAINFWGGGIHCITQHMPAT